MSRGSARSPPEIASNQIYSTSKAGGKRMVLSEMEEQEEKYNSAMVLGFLGCFFSEFINCLPNKKIR